MFESAEQVVCEGCLATHHTRCWHQGAGCSALRPPAGDSPPEKRPPKVRVKRQNWEAEGAVDRRRSLVTSLGKGGLPHDDEPETEFQTPASLPEMGEERRCDKCTEQFVISDRLEKRCKRCVYGTYWKIGLLFAVIVVWKLFL